MDLSEVRKTVGKIRRLVFKNSNSFSVGMLKSHFKGTGLQFKEHQIYAFGDEIRFIDWKLLAKSTHPYIKNFEEERNVEIVVVLDAGESMLYGYEGISKLQASIEICCLLYLLAKETGDYVHTLVVTDKVTHLPKETGEMGLGMLISMLQKMGILDDSGNVVMRENPYEKRNLDQIYKNIMKHMKRKREIVILSDLINLFRAKDISHMTMRGHIHCFRIISPLDVMSKKRMFGFGRMKSGPFLGAIYQDVEDFKNNKNIRSIAVNERYLENFVKEML